MVSPRFYLLLVLLMFIMPAYSIKYTGPLTSRECKAFSKSDDINENVQAHFNCPKRWRSKPKRITRIQKHSLVTHDDDYQ